MRPLQRVLRWGRSSYETDVDLRREREAVEGLGLSWELETARPSPAQLGAAQALVVTSGVRVDAAILGALGEGRVLTTTSGYDHIDLDAATQLGVRVARCPVARRDAVVEWTMGHLTVLMRRATLQWQASRSGHWSRAELPDMGVRAVAGANVVVVGCGVIGARVVTVLRALGANVRVVDPAVSSETHVRWSLEEALVGADAVTLHCSLNASSHCLLGPNELDRLPPHAVVVNSARGAALDVEAAAERVMANTLGGLAVDVFAAEPRVGADLAVDHPQVLYTPHAAGYTFDLGRRVVEEVRGTLAAWLRDEPAPHPVGESAKIP